MSQALPIAIREAAPPSVEETVASSASDFLDLAKRRAKLIAACAATTTLLACAFLANQTPLYRATAELLVDPQTLQVVGKDIVRQDTAASIDFANVDSQALVMVSGSVLNQLVDDLGLEDDPALRARPGLLTRLLGGETPAQTRASTIEALRKAVVARRVDNSLVFEVTTSHPNAEQAAAITNRLAAIFLRQGNDGRGQAVKRAGDSLLEQLTDLRQQLNAAEVAVEKFRSANDLISTGEAGLIVNQQLRDLYSQITTSETEVARLAARRDQIAKLGPDSLLTDRLSDALNSPTIIALRTQYAQTAQEAARMAETLLPRHPRLVEVRAELAAARRSLAEELDRLRASIVQDFAQAQDNLKKLRARADTLTKSQVSSSESEIRLRQLESEAEAIRTVYNASLGRAKELEQQGKIQTSNSRLISAAPVPQKPAKAPATIVLPAALIFGATLGLALAFLLDLVRGAAPNARAAAEMVGVESFATLKRRGAKGAIDERDPAALVAIARRLQGRAGAKNPAVVVVAGTLDLDGAVRRSVLAGLARALAGLGEGVWICAQNDRDEPMHVERIRPLHATGGDLPTSAGPLVEAAKRAQSMRVMEALQGRATGRGAGSEFLLLTDDDASGLAASTAMADAVIVVFEPGRTKRRTLRDLVGLLDPSGDRMAALIAVEPAAVSRFALPEIATRRFRKAAA
ncbi:GumC family protein [Methylopila sp. M107]|uniref:GumC family protein n=1 Tax=Methylopila sp. M107 TaxID=1101190 RepID=UPI0003795C9C|nr:GumC family protein [Methylopila sp. M107]